MEKLPTENLICIFGHLDEVSLKKASKVCIRWHQVITETSSLARKPNLNIKYKSLANAIDKLKEFPFRNVDVNLSFNYENENGTDKIREFYKIMKNILTTIGQRLETFSLRSLEGYIPILLQMNPNMRNLHLAYVDYTEKYITCHQLQVAGQQTKQVIDPNVKDYFGIDTEIPIQVAVKEDWSNDKKAIICAFPYIPVVTLNNLKFMKIENVQNILYWLEAPNLETLIIKYDRERKGVIEFLKTCEKSLKNLTINPFFINYVENLDNLKLEKLKVGSPSNCLNENGYINFLMKQSSSLRELTVQFYSVTTYSTNVIDYINKNLNLTKLSLVCKSMTLQSIEKRDVVKINNLKNFITKCDKVTTLDLDFNFFVDFDVISYLAMSMPNLKSLTIHTFFSAVFPASVLSGLETLKIIDLQKPPNRTTWYKIALACPNIKELSLIDDNFEISSIDLEEVLKNSPNLRILNLTGNKMIRIYDNFFDIFLGERSKVLRINVYAAMKQNEFNKKIKKIRCNLKIQTVFHKIHKKDY